MKATDKLRAYWSKRENDLMLWYPAGSGTKSDVHWLNGQLSKEFTDELTRRGYDVETLRFAVEPLAGNERFVSQQKETPQGG